jgi:hypothetical protein
LYFDIIWLGYLVLATLKKIVCFSPNHLVTLISRLFLVDNFITYKI